MCLLVDRRVGSNDLFPQFEAMGLHTTLATLDYGDCAWTGIGLEGPVSCAVEIKTVTDLLASMQSGRLAGHQLPGLVSNYDRVYLLIEGATRPDAEGGLEHYVQNRFWGNAKLGGQTRGFTYRAFEKFLTTVCERGNVSLRHTTSRAGTVQTVATLYQWWMDGWEEHDSILALDRTTEIKLAEKVRQEKGAGVSLLRSGPSFKRRIAAQLPKIGVDKSGMIAGGFKNARAIANATEKDLAKLPGIGKEMARQIVAAWEDESN